jgi:negative regulator of flagellin synthesis FlgM
LNLSMSIEINGPQGRTPTELADPRRPADDQEKATASPTPTASTAAGDKLSLTSEASQLKTLESEIAELPVVDTQRVQEVQRSLATGSFQIDPASVADKLLQFEAGLASN